MVPLMRSTVRIDDDILLQLKALAREKNVSLTQVLNRTLRTGLQTSKARASRKRRYREVTHSMGVPRADLRKALAVASALEDDEIARKISLRK